MPTTTSRATVPPPFASSPHESRPTDPEHGVRDLLAATSHRPWPLSRRPWIMRQRWHDLLFAHWAVEPDLLRALVPSGLELDLHEGLAWLGVVPFRMSGVRLRGLPPLPGTTAFPELNVRTYVRLGERPGVHFFSLDAASKLAVRVARAWFALPYFDARMSCTRHDDWIRYSSTRTHQGAAAAELEVSYRPIPQGARDVPGDFARADALEHFLTARYALFVRGRDGRLRCGEIHHRPWPLQRAEARFESNSMARAAGVELDRPPESLLFARELDVLVWSPRPVAHP